VVNANATICLVLFLFVVGICGCGSGEKTTVITPGPDYQLTPEEQTYKDAEDRLRGEG